MAASPGVVDTVVKSLAAPQGVGIVELEKVNPSARIGVGASIHLLITVPAVNWYDDGLCWTAALSLPPRQPLHVISLN